MDLLILFYFDGGLNKFWRGVFKPPREAMGLATLETGFATKKVPLN